MVSEPGTARSGEQDERRRDQQEHHRGDDPARHVLLRVARLLGRQRDALDGEEEPDAVDEGSQHARVPERQEVAGPGGVGRRDRQQVVEAELRDHRADEDHQRGHRDAGDEEGQLQRLTHAVQVHADEDRVAGEVHRPAAGQPEQAERLDVAADEHHDRGRRDGVLDEDRGAGGEPAERPEGAGGRSRSRRRDRQRGGHLGQAEDHRGVHGRHQDGGDQQTAPAALGQAEVPAREVARDDVRDAETRPAAASRRRRS
jgi:hypothetical protein